MKKFLLLFFLWTPIIGFSQPNFAKPYYMTSQNGKFYFKSIPYGYQPNNIEGRTDVFNSTDSTLIYSISRYLSYGGVVLSNDGKSILYSINMFYNYDTFDKKMLLFYTNGELAKTFDVEQLIKRNIDDYMFSIFYRNWDSFEWENGRRVYHDSVPDFVRKLVEAPLFSNGNTAYLATRDYEILQFNLNSGNLESRSSLRGASKLVLDHFNSPQISFPDFENPNTIELPPIANGSSYQESFAKEFNFKYDGNSENVNYKYYRLEITCLIDFEGNCIEAYADFEDSTINDRIESFFLNQKFEKNIVPKITERWYYIDWSSFRKVDSITAINEKVTEREQERRQAIWKIKQDTLDGIYIPNNLENCFRELDKNLSEKNKEEFKKSSPMLYHMSIGRHLRNSWGLWSNSRLKEYFLDIGVTHPDDMSTIILDSYYRYLNEKPIDLDYQPKRYALTHRPKIKIPKKLKFE